jgi:hypothetical protein
MSLKLMRIEPKNEEQYQQFLADDKDSIWFSDHYEQIKEKYKGKYIAVVNEELFVGENLEEAELKAKAKYPDRDPLINHIPYKQRILIL